MSHRYVVLGDIVASRDIADREAFQEVLEGACAAVNETYAEDIDAEFTLLKGVDEVGGVLASPRPVYDVVDGFARHLRPNEVRIAVATGTVDVDADSGDVTRMDGPAFHRADDLVADLAGSEFRFALDLEDPPLGATLADTVNLLLFRKREWTDRQREVVARYEALGSQRAVADELDVSQPAVSRALDRATYGPLREIEGRLRETLARYER